MKNIDVFFCILSVFTGSSSQILMRMAAISLGKIKIGFIIFCAFILQMISFVLVLLALKTMPISQVVPFAGFAYFIVPLLAKATLKERLPRFFWLGNALIFLGVVSILLNGRV
jgi:uncharacterized membrane protein